MDLFKIFADSEPLQPAQYEIKDLEKTFPDFQHHPYDQAGFDAVMLPFVYTDPDHTGNANEALAFDGLMSYDLDWSPGSYCSRHAFYVFQHDVIRIVALRQQYASNLIASVVNTWRGTHAVGGELIRTAGGYKGKLQIFGADGGPVFSHNYDDPRSYWDLLGDMDVDAMTFLDAKPSTALIAYLHQPRCVKSQSLIDLGSAAFMQERSPGAFDVYQSILKADPSFAMVRTWYANQKYVHDRDGRSAAAQLGIALSTRLEPSALGDFIPRDCPDSELAGEYGYYLNDAAKLVSEDNPLVIGCRLGKGYYGDQSRGAIVYRGLKAAARFPNSHYLVRDLAMRVDDAWMSASLLTSSLHDCYLPGFNDKARIEADLAYYCTETAHDNIAMQLLSGLGTKQPQSDLYLLLESLTRGGRFSEAADCYRILSPEFNATEAKWMAPYAAFSAVVTGNATLLDKVLKDQHDVLALERLDDVFDEYRDAMQGKTIDPQALLGSRRPIDFPMVWNVLLIAYCDAKGGTCRYHQLMTQCNYEWPIWRLAWIAQDDYQRRDPSSDGAAFYEYLQWMFGDDPWVVKAVADFHQRGGADYPINVAAVRADLIGALHDGPYQGETIKTNWSHVVTPWRVGACLHQLLKQNKIHDAADIALMYKNFESMGTFNPGRHNVALELWHKVNLWKSPA